MKQESDPELSRTLDVRSTPVSIAVEEMYDQCWERGRIDGAAQSTSWKKTVREGNTETGLGMETQ